jgi:hypothetical protein
LRRGRLADSVAFSPPLPPPRDPVLTGSALVLGSSFDPENFAKEQ